MSPTHVTAKTNYGRKPQPNICRPDIYQLTQTYGRKPQPIRPQDLVSTPIRRGRKKPVGPSHSLAPLVSVK